MGVPRTAMPFTTKCLPASLESGTADVVVSATQGVSTLVTKLLLVSTTGL